MVFLDKRDGLCLVHHVISVSLTVFLHRLEQAFDALVCSGVVCLREPSWLLARLFQIKDELGLEAGLGGDGCKLARAEKR